MADEDPLQFYTAIGDFQWSPDWDAIEHMIDAVGAHLEDIETKITTD